VLLGNYSVLNKSPGRFFGGSTTSAEVQVPSNWQKSGAARNSLYISQATTALVLYSIPSANYAGKTWMLPQKSGEMSSRNDTVMSFAAAASGLRGITSPGSAVMTFTVADAAGGLITSGAGSAAFSITGTGQLLASLSAIGSASFAITTNTPILGAEANAVGAATMTFTGTLTPYAIGIMSGSTVDDSVLTGDTIASAVWGASAAAFNAAGTTGNKLNTAGSGGVDTAALAAAVWAYTVRGLTATVDADVRYVNGVEITGTGVEGDTWGPA
jgi:hypothetical protein